MRLTSLPMLWAVAVLCLYTTGCTSTRDVSRDKSYLGGAEIGAVYRLRFPVFCYDTNSGRFFFDPNPVAPGLWLLPEKSRSWEELPSLSEYKKTGKPYAIRGVVEAGTSIQLTRITYYNYFEGETSYYEFIFLNGPFKGRRVCANKLMVERTRLQRVLNETFLKRVR